MKEESRRTGDAPHGWEQGDHAASICMPVQAMLFLAQVPRKLVPCYYRLVRGGQAVIYFPLYLLTRVSIDVVVFSTNKLMESPWFSSNISPILLTDVRISALAE